MNKRICLPAVLLVLPFATTAARAQAPTLEPGARVRVTVPHLGLTRHAATFETLRGDTLVVVADSVIYCTLASVTRLDAHQGRRGHPAQGALIGLAVGAVAGGVTGAVGCGTSWWCTTQKGVSLGAVIGGLTGALLGTGIGALIKTDRWEQVPLDRLRVSVLPQRDGRSVFAVSIAF
ncbi:MAG: hypothetical protein GTN62_12050 [Gemmatimonadales bacterium]|nr:hypothetical protein [Gemmatimonadales bacterium]NIN12452.1 hypothetical protein [Gemmatimonadales bacterium]NIN50828.1 hypothetical protein [Gemmatimonadales bacterium]NIP08292.1 hypothetical protein [Gemmatimonadales bacterium]NIR00816.1 hypothetical protein [Gemmatimonadales bacterium]